MCPGSSYTDFLKKSVITATGELYSTGYIKTAGFDRTTYITRAPSASAGDSRFLVDGLKYWKWPYGNPSYWRKPWGLASLLRNNLTGMLKLESPAPWNAVKYSAPRSLVACATPCPFWGYNPIVHRRRGVNALFADGTVFTKKCTPTHPLMLPTGVPGQGTWQYRFFGLDTAHPSYEPPWTNYDGGYK